MEAAAAEAEVQQRAAREGRLWSNIYSYSVEMRQYDRSATEGQLGCHCRAARAARVPL